MSFKNKKPYTYKKSDTSNVATTTHIFQSLIKMLSDVDPVTLQRTRDKYLKKQNPRHGNKRNYRELLNETALLLSYEKNITGRSNGYIRQNSTVELFNFLSTLDLLKKKLSSFSKTTSVALSNNNTVISLLKTKITNILSNNISNILSDSQSKQLSKKSITHLSKDRNLYILNLLWASKTNSSRLILKDKTSPIYHNQDTFQKAFLLVKSLSRLENCLEFKVSLRSSKTSSSFICLNLFLKKPSSFFSWSQFNFLKTVLSNIENVDPLVYKQNVLNRQFQSRLLTKSNNNGQNDDLSRSFFNILSSYISNSSTRFNLDSKRLNFPIKELVLKYYQKQDKNINYSENVSNFKVKTNSNKLKNLFSSRSVPISKRLLKYIEFLNSDPSTLAFLKDNNLQKVKHILSEMYNYSRIQSSRFYFRNRYKKKLGLKIKKYSLFISNLLTTNSTNQNSVQLLSILMFIKRITFLLKLTNKKTTWLKYQLFKLKKLNLDSINISKLIDRKKRNRYSKIRYRLWQAGKNHQKNNFQDKLLINQIVHQSSKSKFYISKSNNYSFFYSILLEQNHLLKLFRNFLIKNGLKRKANRWLITILTLIKQNYKICPVRTLRFLILRHFKAGLIKERKLKKKLIYVPKRLSVKKQLFYMVFFFFKEINNFSSGYENQFSYRLLGNKKDRFVHIVENYIRHSIDSDVINNFLVKKNTLLEEKMYSLKHFIKKSTHRRNNKFKQKKKYSFYKGHPNFNL